MHRMPEKEKETPFADDKLYYILYGHTVNKCELDN